MWRVAAFLCVLSGEFLQAACKCESKNLEELRRCFAGSREAENCVAENSTEEQILTCLKSYGETPTNSTEPANAKEQGDQITEVDTLDEWFEKQTWNFFLSDIGRPGSRDTKDVYLSYVTVTGPGKKGAILLIGGNGESVFNYDETMKNFVNMGYSPIYAYTHRGKGTSDRLLNDPFKQHVEHSDDFVRDCRKFVGIVVAELAQYEDMPLFMYCHSLGCAVSLSYLIEEYEHEQPQVFNAVVAQAPLIKADTDPFPYDIAVAIGETMVFFGQGEEYAPTQDKTFEEWYDESTCTKGSIARCRRIKKRCTDKKDAIVGHDKHVGLCTGGTTGNMAKEFFDMYHDTFEGFMAQAGKKIAPPILLQQSGDPDGTDGLVFNPPQTEFCQKSCANCTLIKHPEATHRLVTEVDAIFFTFLQEADEFYQKNRGSKVPQTDPPPQYKAEGEGCNDDLECLSRVCDAHYAFDVFGGQCVNGSSFVSHATSWPRCSAAALVASAAAAELLPAW